MPSLSRRLKAVTKQVEQWERTPSLANALALGRVDEYLSLIESMIPAPKLGGRPKIGDTSLRGLERLVDECKRRLALKTDKAALQYLAERMFGHRGFKRQQWVKTHQNLLAKARKLPRK